MNALAAGLIYCESPGVHSAFRKDLRLVLLNQAGTIELALEIPHESAWTGQDSEALMQLIGKLYPGFYWLRVKGAA